MSYQNVRNDQTLPRFKDGFDIDQSCSIVLSIAKKIFLYKFMQMCHFWNRTTAHSNACNFGFRYCMIFYEVSSSAELPIVPWISNIDLILINPIFLYKCMQMCHFWNPTTEPSNACNFGFRYCIIFYEVSNCAELPDASMDIKHLSRKHTPQHGTSVLPLSGNPRYARVFGKKTLSS